MKIKHKFTVLLFQFALLTVGVGFTAKPVYHFLKREYLHLQARQRWKRAIAKPGVGQEDFWLSVPSADIDILVLNSEKKEDLYDFPVSRKIGNNLNVIMAHRDIHFGGLGEAVTGSKINLQLRNSKHNSYTVVDSEIIKPEELETRLESKSEGEWLVLMTCYPFQYIGSAPKRFLLWCKKSKADIPVRLESPDNGKEYLSSRLIVFNTKKQQR